MLEDWQLTENGTQIMQCVETLQRHIQLLLKLPLLPDQQGHVQQIEQTTNTLSALVVALFPAQNLASSAPQTPPATPESTQEPTPTPDSTPLTEPASPLLYPLNILLVEDNPFTQKLMVRLLTLHNHRVTLANHGQEALTRLKEADAQPFDIVLMDIRMPVLDGLETTIAIRQWEAARLGDRQQEKNGIQESHNERAQPLNRRLPIIAVTALTSPEDRQHALQAGMDGFHGKPVQANQLFAEMERLILVTPTHPLVSDTVSFAQAPNTRTNPSVVQIELDMGILLKTVENDWALLGEVVDLYRMDAPRQLQRIQHGIEQQDADVVREAAHSLKGASGAFGQTPTYDLAWQLEQAGRNHDLQNADELLKQLKCSVIALEKALETEIRKNSGS